MATACSTGLLAPVRRCSPAVSPAVAECDAAGFPVVAGSAGPPLHPASTATAATIVTAVAAPRGRPGLAMTASYDQPAALRASCLVLLGHLAGAWLHRLARTVHLRWLVPGQLPPVDGNHGAGDERGLVRAEPEHGLRHLPGRAGPGHRRRHPGHLLGPRPAGGGSGSAPAPPR